MGFIGRLLGWLRWLVLVPAALSMFWAVPAALTLGQFMADGMGPGMGWLYQGFSKFLSAVLTPAFIVLLAWRIAPRSQLTVARTAMFILVGLHVLGLAFAIVGHAQGGRPPSTDPFWWILTEMVLAGIAAVVAFIATEGMESARAVAQPAGASVHEDP